MTTVVKQQKTNSKKWGEKPYFSLDYWCRQTFHEKVYKISLESGMTCPNRDGKLGNRGCIFCSGSGSGDFAAPRMNSITEQIDYGIAGLKTRKRVGNKFIAYFQSFTNTYGPAKKLRPMFMEALSHPDVVMLSIATRPDCLPDEILDLLKECNQIKPVMVELGLQTIHEKTAQFIRRGYPTEVFYSAVEKLHSLGIQTVVHVIAGLPYECKEDFIATIDAVAKTPIQGIKLQLLHVLKGTDLADYLDSDILHILSEDEYLDWICDAIMHLPENIVVHRVTGDGPKALLLAPLWSSSKRTVLNHLHKKMKDEQIWQGKQYNPS